MHKANAQRLARWFAVLGVSIATAVATFGAPAQAAPNPYTPERACATDFGGTWSRTTDGHRNVTTATGAKWGDVYLMYKSSTGENCVATIKTAFVGTSTYTEAWLLVQGSTWKVDRDTYRYYAAVKAPARDRCVQYVGIVRNGTSSTSTYAWGGRTTWGNCG
jgi:hypothetical protein